MVLLHNVDKIKERHHKQYICESIHIISSLKTQIIDKNILNATRHVIN